MIFSWLKNLSRGIIRGHQHRQYRRRHPMIRSSTAIYSRSALLVDSATIIESLEPRVVLSPVPIVSLFGTGVQSNSTSGNPSALVSPGSPDPHYRLIVTPTSFLAPSYVTQTTGYPFTGPSAAWAPNDSSSQWISPHANENSLDGGAPSEPVGTYEYETQFDLSGFIPSTATISGRIYSDNDISGVYLNGVRTNIAAGGFGGTVFNLTTGFVTGANTIDVIMTNNPSSHSNPSGMRLGFSSAIAETYPPNITITNSTIAENQPIDTLVGVLSTTDPDPNTKLTFDIGQGDTDNSSFRIGGQKGLRATTVFNYEAKSSYSIRVRATDSGGQSSVKIFTINVTDLPEAPTIPNQSFYLLEHSSYGTSVGSVYAYDEDRGDTKTYSIIGGNEQGAFSISSAGVIRVADSSKLNFNTNPAFYLSISVTDSAGLTASNTVPIYLTKAPTLPVIGPQAFWLQENTVNGTSVATVFASDQNPGASVTYNITGGDGLDAFTINNVGVISVADSTKLDFETHPVFNLTVTVTNSLGLSASNTITIKLTDVPEAPTIAYQVLQVLENSANGTVVGGVVAYDQDAGDTKTFNIIGGNDFAAFSINSAGVITVADSTKLDYETNPTFDLIVRVTDSTNLSANNTVRIQLLPVNEPPLLAGVEPTPLILSDTSAAVVSTALAVVDVDSPNLAGATVQFASGYQKGFDSLRFTNTAKISGSWDAVVGVLTLTGVDTVANYQSALKSVQFQNSGTNTSARTISFQVSDGSLMSNTVSRVVDAPPQVLTMVSVGPNPTASSSAQFTITFSESVTGVDPTDFSLVTTNTVGATKIQVTAVSPSVYTVTVSGITGNGTLGLNLVNDASITDLGGNSLRSNFTGPVITIDTVPSVTTQPSNVTATAGTAASFTAIASGAPVPTVQWQISTGAGTTWSDIAGANSTTYSFTTTLGNNGNLYRAVFTNEVGTVTTATAALTVTPAHLSVYWVGLGDGRNWSQAKNWSNNTVPSVNDDVTINAAAGTLIDGPTVSTTINSLTITSAKLFIDYASLAVTNSVIVSSGQTLTVTNNLSLTAGSITLNDATLTLSAGKILGGIITMTGAGLVSLIGPGTTSTLDGVTVNGTISNITNNGVTLVLKNTVTLNGTLLIGATNGSTYDSVSLGDATSSPATLTGNATVIFGGTTSNVLSSNVSGGVATLGPTVTLRGKSGMLVNASSSGTFLNQGTISSDVSGGTIRAGGNPGTSVGLFQNAGVLGASNGGTLQLAGNWTNTGSISPSGTGTVSVYGVIDNRSATNTFDGTLTLNTGTIKGGSISAIANGVVSLIGPGTTSTLDGVTVNGTLSNITNNGVTLVLKNTVTLNGTLLIGATDGSTYDSVSLGDATSSPATLTGNATVIFGGTTSNVLSSNVSGGVATLGPTVTLRGKSGMLVNASSSGTFLNQGTISSDVSGGTIRAGGNPGTSVGLFQNAGVLGASNGGTLQLAGNWTNTGSISPTGTGTVSVYGVIDNRSATNIIDGSLALNAATIAGGTITTTANGVVSVIGSITNLSTLGGASTLDGVTVNGMIRESLSNSSGLILKNTVILNGTLLLGGSNGLTSTYDRLYLGDGTSTPATLSGNATIVFGDSSSNILFNNVSGGVGTLASTVTVRGNNGYLWNNIANTTLHVQGTVSADVTGGKLLVGVGSGAFRNSGNVTASNGGSIVLSNTWTNTGVFGSTGTGSLILQAATIVGGFITQTGSNFVSVNGANFLDGVTVNGNLDETHAGGIGLTLKNTVTLNGTLLLGATDGSTYDYLRLGDGSSTPATLAGNAIVVFGGHTSSSFQSNVNGGTAIVASTVTVRGKNGAIGNISPNGAMLVQGKISADVSGGTLLLNSVPGTFQNAGTLTSSNGGTLSLFKDLANSGTISSTGTGKIQSSASVDNTGGTILVDGWVNLQGGAGAAVKGGVITETVNGLLTATSSVALDGVTINASIVSMYNYILTLKNTVTINGTVSLGATDGSNWGQIYLGDTSGTPTTLAGNVNVVFGSDLHDSIFFNVNGGTASLASAVMVHGKNGNLFNNFATGLVQNQGKIVADVAGGTITLGNNNGTFQNTGTLGAINGGLLIVNGTGTTNSLAGLMESPESTIQLSGSLLSTATSPSLYDPQGNITFNGGGSEASPKLLQATSQDFGNIPSGYIGNSAFGSLNLTTSTYLKLFDQINNTGSSAHKAVYVKSLSIPTGSTLDLNGLNLYTLTSAISGHVLNGTITQIGAGPLIAQQPSNATVHTGSTVSFTAIATGIPSPTVQWQTSTNGGSTWTNVAGATSTTYSFVTVSGNDGSQYRAVFSNVLGTATSNAATVHVSSSISWLGSGDGHSWSDAANWSTHTIPITGDDVTINAPTGTTIHGPVNPVTINSLNVISANVIVDGGVLTVANGVTVNSGQSLTVGNYTTLIAGTISLVDSTLTLTQNGTITGATITETGSAMLTIIGSGILDTVTVNGGINLTHANGDYLILRNTITLNGTLSIGAADGSTYGILYLGDGTSNSASLIGNASIVFGKSAKNAINTYVNGGTQR